MPSESTTVPSAGRPVTVAVSDPTASSESTGGVIPIGVAPLFGSTASVRSWVVGDVVSIVNVSPAESGLTLPPESVSLADSVCVPVESTLVVTDHDPFADTVPPPTSTPPSNRLTVSPASPVPVIDGADTLVKLSPTTPLSDCGSSASPD